MRRSLRVPLLMPNPTVTIRALVRLAICAMALAVPSAAFADCGHEIMVRRAGLFNEACGGFYRATERVARERASGGNGDEDGLAGISPSMSL